jgi:PAS domain S-box-containing protein
VLGGLEVPSGFGRACSITPNREWILLQCRFAGPAAIPAFFLISEEAMGTKERFDSVPTRSSLRLVLMAPFVLLVSITVIVTGHLSFRSGRQAVFELADQLCGEIAFRVEEELHRFFAAPHEVNQMNRDAVSLGLLRIDDLSTWQGYLWHQAKVFQEITNIAAGNANGEYIGIDKRDNGQAVGQLCDASTGFALFSFEVGDLGVPASPGENAGPYDPRTRPWYRSPSEAGQPQWSDIYKHFVDPELQIALSLPLYDTSGALTGVTTAAVRLSGIAAFLQKLKVGKTGLTYIVDASGHLIASSVAEPSFSISSEGEVRRARADESGVALIRESCLSVKRMVGDWGAVDQKISVNDSQDSGRLFVRVIPFRDSFGLDWRVVVVVPEADFMTRIHANVRTTALLCLAALLGSMAAGLLAVRWIAGPILLMNDASGDLIAGREMKNLPTYRGDEIGSLARSFDRMARETRQSLVSLKSEVAERRRVEAALRESEAESRSIFENAIEGIFRSTPDGRFLIVNPAFARIYGYDSPEELIRSITDIGRDLYVRHEDRANLLDQFNHCDVVTGFEQEMRRKDGSTGWVSVSARCVRNEGGDLIHIDGFAFDITERKQAEEALRQEKHFTDALIDSMPAIFYVLDEQGRLARWNKAFERATGYDAETISRMRAIDFVVPEDQDVVAEKIREVFLQGYARVDGRVLTKSGQAVPFHLTGLRFVIDAKPYLLGVGLDVSDRVSAEAEAARLQTLLRSVILQSPVPMVLALPDGTIALFNDSCRGMLGATGETRFQADLNLFTLEPTWVDYSAEGARVPRSELPLALALMGKTTRGREMRVLRQDGTERWILVDAVPIYDDRDAIMAGFLSFVDISERKLAEAALRESEERFSVFMENLPAGVFMKDTAGRVVYANRYLCELFGWGNVVGKSTHDLLPPDAARRMEADDRAALAGELTTVAEWVRDVGNRERIFQTSKFPVPREGRPPLLGGIAVDITDRNRAEEELRASEAFLDTIIEQSPFSMWVSDSTGTLIRMNQACRALLHGSDEELVGKYNLFKDNVLDSRGVMPFVKRVFELGEKARFTVDYDSSELTSLQVAETVRVVLEVTISPVLDGRGQVTHAIVQQLDLSERIQAEEALRNSLLEKECLLKEVHHRVKNNLQVISSLLQLQARKVQIPEVLGVLKDTRSRVRSMSLLHETLYRSGNLAKVSFPQYIKDVCSQVARSYASGTENVRLKHDIVDVTLDLDRAIPAGLIINELVSNAFKHAFASRSEGMILVELHRVLEDQLLLRVSDDGIGMAPEVDPRSAETLGLLLVRNLTRQLDGRMSVDSGHGTVFEIVFPADPR